MGGGFTQPGEFFIQPSGAFVSGGGLGFLNRDFISGIFNPPPAANIDLNFASGQYTGVIGLPTAFLTTTRAAPAAYAVDSGGNWISFAANTPRITNLGLLVEESRTNIQLWSQDLTQATAWNLVNVAVVAGVASPLGGLSQKLQDSNTTNAQHSTTSNANGPFTAGVTLTYSGFFRTAEYNQVQLVIWDPAFTNGFAATLNTTTGVVSGQGGVGTGTFIASSSTVYANGWTRLVLTGIVSPSATTAITGVYLQSAAGYIGVVGSGVYTTQQQVEVGAFATSPIPTTTVSVTRAADVISLTSSPVFGGAYTLFGSGTPTAPITSATNQVIMQADDGSANNRANISRVASTGNGVGGSVSGGTSTSVTTGNVWAQNTAGKLAFADTGGSQAVALNGGAVATAAAALPIGVNTTRIGSNQAGATFFNGPITRVALWPTTFLTGPQLQALTT